MFGYLNRGRPTSTTATSATRIPTIPCLGRPLSQTCFLLARPPRQPLPSPREKTQERGRRPNVLHPLAEKVIVLLSSDYLLLWKLSSDYISFWGPFGVLLGSSLNEQANCRRITFPFHVLFGSFWGPFSGCRLITFPFWILLGSFLGRHLELSSDYLSVLDPFGVLFAIVV
jgi:hypothetical protein